MGINQWERIATEVVTGLLLVGLALLLVIRGAGWVWLFALLALILVNGGWALMLLRAVQISAGPWWYRIASQRGVQLAVVGGWYMLFLALFVPHAANVFVAILLFLFGIALIGLAQYFVIWAQRHGPQPSAATTPGDPAAQPDDLTQPLEP